jgi:hypothetical protein
VCPRHRCPSEAPSQTPSAAPSPEPVPTNSAAPTVFLERDLAVGDLALVLYNTGSCLLHECSARGHCVMLLGTVYGVLIQVVPCC